MCVGPYRNEAAVGRISCGQSGTLHSRQRYAKQLSILRKNLSVMPPEFTVFICSREFLYPFFSQYE